MARPRIATFRSATTRSATGCTCQRSFATHELFPGPLGSMLRVRRTDLRSSGDLLARGALKERVELVELAAYAAADLFAELEHPLVGD
jgi:hypothetical protein